MFDINKIPTVNRVFKNYSLSLAGNANFVTITCERQGKAKLFALSKDIPLNEAVQFVCRLFPNAVITNCEDPSENRLYVRKNPIMVAVQLLAAKYYFVFPLLHNLARHGNCYSLLAPYAQMQITVKRQFDVCALIKTGRVYYQGMPDVPENLLLCTNRGTAYLEQGDEYADQCLTNELEVLENGCEILRKSA